MKSYNASELFDISLSGSFPLNLTFVLRDVFLDDLVLNNHAIYSMTFKGELLYIGCYCGKANAAAVRWQNELQTHSMRGVNVGFTPTAFETLQGTQDLLAAGFPNHIEDTGYLTSAKRVIFAEENWYLLSQHPNNWLSHFSFCLMVLPPKIKRTKKEFETLTNQLRKFYIPRCNG